MTTIQCEHFVLGYMDGRYRLLKSKHLDETVSAESLDHLRQLGSKKPVIVGTSLCKDRLFAVSYLRADKDEIGRPTGWNHTIIVKCDAIIDMLKKMVKSDMFITEPNGLLLNAPLAPISFETEKANLP
jgi:hypothetical protein